MQRVIGKTERGREINNVQNRLNDNVVKKKKERERRIAKRDNKLNKKILERGNKGECIGK